MSIPAHPHRTHSSQRSRKRKRPYRAQRSAERIRAEMEATGVIVPCEPKNEKPVEQAGFFACIKFILMRWFK